MKYALVYHPLQKARAFKRAIERDDVEAARWLNRDGIYDRLEVFLDAEEDPDLLIDLVKQALDEDRPELIKALGDLFRR